MIALDHALIPPRAFASGPIGTIRGEATNRSSFTGNNSATAFFGVSPSSSPSFLPQPRQSSFGNPIAFSASISPFGYRPDLSKADPNILKKLDVSDLVYDQRSGHVTLKSRYDEAIHNSNSPYLKSGAALIPVPGGDERAKAYSDYINSLPKVATGSLALLNLKHTTGFQSYLNRGF